MRRARGGHPGRAQGFTLIEVLVVLAVLSLLALMAWRGLDAQLRQQQALQSRSEDLQTLQAALAQWHTDLEQLHTSPELQAWHWDGRVLRITRRSPAGTVAAVQVVAWSLQTPAPPALAARGPHWMRWQSPPLVNTAEWRSAWDAAARWNAQDASARLAGDGPDLAGVDNAGDSTVDSASRGDGSSTRQARAIALWPLAQWQLYVHRGGAWTNPLSSDAVGPQDSAGSAPAGPGPDPAVVTGEPAQRVPDAVRVLLTLPPGQALAGTLQSDWVRPVFTTPGS